MNLRLSDTPSPPGTPRDSVGSWLGVMVGMIGASDTERRAVREELESHLTERVRDLMLTGMNEAEATRQAIAELGDAAALARRYQDAIGPSKRRLIMQVGALSFVGAAAVLSIVALTNGKPQPVAEQPALARAMEVEVAKLLASRAAVEMQTEPVSRPALVGASEFTSPPDEPMARLAGVRVTLTAGTTWEQFFAMLVPEGAPVIRREAFTQGLQLTDPVGLGSFTGSAADAIHAINSTSEVEIGVRLDGDDLVVAPAEYFDRLEQTLATYDLSPLIEQRSRRTGEPAEPADVAQQVQSLITSFVFPDCWRDNGGDRASMQNFESRLFVQAPKRFHPKIAWILGELGAGADKPAIGVSTRDRVPVLGDVPLLNRMFESRRDASAAVGSGPITVRSSGADRVNVQGASGAIEANEVTLTPGGGGSPMLEKLVMPAAGTLMTVSVEQGRVVLDQAGERRTADVIELDVPEGWFVRDEWGRKVVPEQTPKPGNRVVTFTAPHGYLFGTWRRTGITGDRHEICPPGTPDPKPAEAVTPQNPS